MIALGVLSTPVLSAPSDLVPNPSFEAGTDKPEGWSPVSPGVPAQWETTGRSGRRSLGLRGGRPDDSVYWRSDGVRLAADTRFRFSFWAKAENASGGSIISGPSSVNHDFSLPTNWARFSFVGRMPRDVAETYLRLGQWNAGGAILFDDVALTPVTAVYRRSGALELGEGESVTGKRYRFDAPLNASNDARPLAGATAGFNTNRWVLSRGSEIVYEHRVGDLRQASARVAVNVGYHTGGRLVVEARGDAGAWVSAGTRDASGRLEADLPASLFPARTVTVRLRAETPQERAGDSHPGSFQINGYTYEASLADATPAPVTGRTIYVEETHSAPTPTVTLRTLGDLLPGGENIARLSVGGASPGALTARLTITPPSGAAQTFTGKSSADGEIAIPYRMASAGAHTVTLRVESAKGALYEGRADAEVPGLYAADYGYRISSGANGDLWWTEAPYKVSKERPVPTAERKAVEIRAARNEYEPFQIVVRPRRDIRGATVIGSGFAGPGGARIGAEHVSVCEVAYVPITQPTDATGTAAPWPDPLPPLREPIDLAAGRNQPFWVTVYVPENARPGRYTGSIVLSAPGWRETVPVSLTVRNFTLPRETHVQSAFGLSASRLRDYHGAKTTEETAALMERYYKNFARHRISPYDPAFNAPIRVDWGLETAWEGGQRASERPFAGGWSLHIRDDSSQSAVGAQTGVRIPVTPGKPYTLSFATRTGKPGQTGQVSVQTYDAAGNWLSGRNLDTRVAGTGEWAETRVDLTAHLREPMRYVSISLRPVPWSEDGAGTGEAWFDNVRLTGADGVDLLRNGDFEAAEAADPARVTVDFAAFDKAAERAFSQHRFTSFRLALQGMGGGTFHERSPGRIGPFVEGTPQYEALFGAYLSKLQAHLDAKGWLDKAYVYWFDEPDPKDYEFVRQGMERIHRHAPKLARMLTEQPEPGLIGAVDLWCPITDQFDPAAATARMKAGERFWWYVCTGPKAPYATLFIDHPAVELRTWLWQTWKYNVSGILVWESVYWSSPTAYPDSRQDPWTDPMSWAGGYGLPTGARSPWGNGDGRFLYPPRRDPNDSVSLVDQDPIDSIRWEMLREGIEDYEYLWMLRDAVAQARRRGAPAKLIADAERLLTVPAEVTTDLVVFSRDPKPLLAHREKVAAAIEALAAVK